MNITLNNGVEMPALGFGVFQTPPEETVASVAEALRVGYRLIDTAASYFNEREVGEGIRQSGLDRSEIFIETKLWISDYGYDEALHSFDKSAGKLGVEQIDLLLLHQPLTADFEKTIAAPPTTCSTWRSSWRRRRCTMTTSSSASCTRTSTSTRA